MAFDCRDNPIRSLPALTHVGILDGESEVVFDTHTHLGYEIHVVRRGAASIGIVPHREPIEVAADDALIVPPGVPHRFEMREPSARIVWLGFQATRRIGIAPAHILHPRLLVRDDAVATRVTFTDIDGAQIALDDAARTLPTAPLTHIAGAPEIGATINEIVAEAIEGRAHAETRVMGLLLSLVAQIQRRLVAPGPLDAGGSAVARALRYIEARPTERLTLTEVAAAIGVSEAHLSRAFRASTGSTVRGYLNGRRVAQARALLGQGYRTIDVARMCGYSSPSTFSRWFREQTGTSPGRAARRTAPNVIKST